MKNLIVIFFILPSSILFGQATADVSLKSVLLTQLKTTHNQKEWFVPANQAVEGLTPEQAMWTDGSSGNHSVGQLTYHLVFWNERELAKFNDQKLPEFSGNNDETFNSFDQNSWADLVKKLDKVLSDWEKAIQNADEKKLKTWYTTIANINTHNAYHTGQIIFVRKLQGSWNPEKGVK
ncbi:MAG TPA: DinB family protein [Cyclobacteriaceae bacterium]